MRCAFGECANCGVKPPFAAAAPPAVARTVTATTTTNQSFLRTRRAFYGGVLSLAGRPARTHSGKLRGLRRGRSAGAWHRLRGDRTDARVPAADRSGGAPRLLALGGDVARDRRLVPQARDGRRRLRRGRAAAGRARARSSGRGGAGGGWSRGGSRRRWTIRPRRGGAAGQLFGTGSSL